MVKKPIDNAEQIRNEYERHELRSLSFVDQLCWHMKMGTENGKYTNNKWTQERLSGKIDASVKSVNSWVGGKSPDKFIDKLIDLFFGNESSADDMKMAFMTAYGYMSKKERKKFTYISDRKYGSYLLEKYEKYIGQYILYRLSFHDENVICVFKMEMQWNKIIGSLTISGFSEDNVRWIAPLSIPQNTSYIQFATASSVGSHSLACFPHLKNDRFLYGAMFTLGDADGKNYSPVLIPVVLEKYSIDSGIEWANAIVKSEEKQKYVYLKSNLFRAFDERIIKIIR